MSPGVETPPAPVDGLKLRREPKSVYVQSSVQSLAFVKVMVAETGTVGCGGSKVTVTLGLAVPAK